MSIYNNIETSGSHIAPWYNEYRPFTYPTLDHNLEVDVCIIGAGIAGVSTAYQLACEGLKVAVLEDGTIGSGETGRTTAHLSNALDDRYTFLIKTHGLKHAQLAAQSHTAAIDWIEQIIQKEQIYCDFERIDGYLFTNSHAGISTLQQELEASHRVGLTDVEWLEETPINFFHNYPCLRFPRQAQFQPLKYLSTLAQKCISKGVHIFEHTHAQEFKGGSPCYVTTSTGQVITAQHLVIATNSPVNDRTVMHTKQTAYRTYVIGATIPKGSLKNALYWDINDPYHYIRLYDGKVLSEWHGLEKEPVDLLIIGGEDHRTGETKECTTAYASLIAWSKQHFPMITSIPYQWSGQVIEPVDGMGFIGRNPMDHENVFIVTGDSGNGMTHGTIAGMLLKDLILKRNNPWADLYNPSRKPYRSIKEFTVTNCITATKYAEHLTKGEVQSSEDIDFNSGAILRQGMKKVAVYKDEKGQCHKFSAVCPHLGGIVHWNPTEETWDCPCHGSRFKKTGEVVNGPANEDLRELDETPLIVETIKA
ncbi:MAG: FAD-dependent oxidoreductase [Chlamydiales bacterium]|jgi:glycine/D-amino acid oxidase-like deaminating enzyme/nitrite reductase/ring-hydroxylating ferredoxin subunit|nr:FAD-dependent oxidoreductase [Chlamydiales bacterium]